MSLDMKEKALENLQNLWMTAYKKLKREKLISQSTLDSLLIPMQKMDWEETFYRSEALIEILSTSKTEQEVLDRAAQL